MPSRPRKRAECGHLMPLRISWSGLRTHEECRQKGYLTRTGKKAPLDDQRVFFAGNVTDRTVRDWLQDDPWNNPGLMPHMVNDIIDKQLDYIRNGDPSKKVPPGVMRWKDANDRDTVREECIRAVTRIEPLLEKFVLPHKFQADVRFDAPLQLPHPAGGHETVTLIGFMDILVYDEVNDRWHVHDVKHTKDDSYWRKTIAQLGYYDLAVLLMHGKPTSLNSLMQPLCKNTMVPFKPSEQSRTELLARISAMANDIWRDKRDPKQGNAGCGFCVVKHACEKFQPVVRKDGTRRITF